MQPQEPYMKRILATFFMLTLSLSAFAAPTPSKINQAAYKLLVKNMNVLTDQDGIVVSTLIAADLKRVSKGDSSYKVTNKCRFDRGDELFKCSLKIMNRSEGLESMKKIDYELERGEDLLPAEFFSLSVQSLIAG